MKKIISTLALLLIVSTTAFCQTDKEYSETLKKYFEIIPVSQQYGITHWSPTDSPDDSGWRKGQPIGLWSLNYNRKPVYAGFAEGLSGK